MTSKTSKFFSDPLMKQSCRSNLILAIVILIVMCLMSTVLNYAASIMGTETDKEVSQTAEEEIYEYVMALESYNQASGSDLSAEEFMEVMLASAGIEEEDLDKMQTMDFSLYFTKIYFTVIGLLPVFVLVILTANSLIAAQVDKGSMAYILATPTKRSAVVITQAIYMILAPLVLMAITCLTRIASTVAIYGEVDIPRTLTLYLGMYLVTEATAGICYLCSCLFNQSQKALAIGGGITLWFFLAALLGMFGSEDMVNMGIGADTLSVFNQLTIVSLFDADAVQTIGTESVDYGFIPGMIILAAVAAVCYIAGAVKFCRKDLPL